MIKRGLTCSDNCWDDGRDMHQKGETEEPLEDGFLEGYRYAIEVLQNHIVKNKK